MKKRKVTLKRLMAAIEEGNYIGFCKACRIRCRRVVNGDGVIRKWRCTLAFPYRTAIIEAYDWQAARDIAAEMFGTQRIHDVKVTLIEDKE